LIRLFLALVIGCVLQTAPASEPIPLWPQLAPGETTRSAGDVLPVRDGEIPPVTRVANITFPTMTAYVAEKPNGTAIVILPGGGFGRVVTDKEGSEAARWLNQLGITAFVLNYRTNTDRNVAGWIKPLQDIRRAMAVIRSDASRWHIDPKRIGILGFSAGGQVAARLLGKPEAVHFDRLDAVDDVPFRPDFGLLLYPWSLYDITRDALVEGIEVSPQCPPTFIVHTHDDQSSSLGAVLFYAGLKRHGIPAELHVSENGGHGYGMRPAPDSLVANWPDLASKWLRSHGLTSPLPMASK